MFFWRAPYARTVLLWVVSVILKCNSNLSFFLNPYFRTFNLKHPEVLILQKDIQDQCPHSKLFPGFRACYLSIADILAKLYNIIVYTCVSEHSTNAQNGLSFIGTENDKCFLPTTISFTGKGRLSEV